MKIHAEAADSAKSGSDAMGAAALVHGSEAVTALLARLGMNAL